MSTQHIERRELQTLSDSLTTITSIAEYSQNNGLLEEIEENGTTWLLSIYTDQLQFWKKIWESNRFGEGKNQTAEARPRTDKDVLLTEGSIIRIPTLSQLTSAETLCTHLNGPMNSDIDRVDNKIYTPCSQEVIVVNITTGCIEQRIKHPLFNDLHSVSFNHDTNTMLVVSSGADIIVEIDRTGNVLWQWDAGDFAEQYGLVDEATQQRRSQLVDVVDYRKWLVPTPAQRTHINTATWLGNERVGVTLFHQGMALVVNKKTNDTQIVLNGLVKPHGFQPTEDGRYVVTSTGQGMVMMLNHEFQVTEAITGFFDNHPADGISWLHTSFPVYGKIVAVDQTLTEIIILDPATKRLQRIKHSDNWKISFIDRA